MLICVSCVFLITTLPLSIFFLTRDIFLPLISVSNHAKQAVVYAALNLLYYTNNAMNFIMYFLTGARFRKSFMSIFLGCARKVRGGRPGGTTSGGNSTISSSGAVTGVTRF